MRSIYGINFFAEVENGPGYSFAGKLGTAIGVLVGRKSLGNLSNDDCLYLGFKQETCNYRNGKDVTAETVRRFSSETVVREKAETVIGTAIYNLMATCNQLNDRVAELEALTKKENTHAGS